MREDKEEEEVSSMQVGPHQGSLASKSGEILQIGNTGILTSLHPSAPQ